AKGTSYVFCLLCHSLFFLFGCQDFVHHSVLLGFRRGHPIIAVRRLLHPVVTLSRMLGNDFVEFFFHFQHFPEVNLRIGSDPLCTARGLVYNHPRVGQCCTFSLGSSTQQYFCH